MAINFSKYYGLSKSQSDLEFVDILLDGDTFIRRSLVSGQFKEEIWELVK